MTSVAAIWRHPIKSHGREALDRVGLIKGQSMPWDRRWAVVHDMAKDAPCDGVWAASQNFMIGTRTPGLAGIWAKLDTQTGVVTLTHPDIGVHSFSPDAPDQHAGFLAWIDPLCPTDRARPSAVVALPDRGFTDTPFPSVSIMNRATHADVEDRMGRSLEQERWRGNLWIDGGAAWEEFDWIGTTIRVGSTVLLVREKVKRCLHTAANPHTGERDADLPGFLETSFGHRDFGVYAEVIEGGDVEIGDKVEVI